jgi:hypothetical protein
VSAHPDPSYVDADVPPGVTLAEYGRQIARERNADRQGVTHLLRSCGGAAGRAVLVVLYEARLIGAFERSRADATGPRR